MASLIVSLITILVIGTTAIATSTFDLLINIVYAEAINTNKYDKSQVSIETSSCANEDATTDILCQNEGSEVQGNENALGLVGQQQVERKHTPPEPPGPPTATTCEKSFVVTLTSEEISAFEEITSYNTEGQVNTITEVCDYLRQMGQIDVVTDLQVSTLLMDFGIFSDQAFEITDSLVKSGIIVSDPTIPITVD